ncbi:gamma-glutamylcyclotransferase [Spirosoma sp. BT702]|uniref:Gamma-glutamylcyclotransferase n=1 Tax=Spirosoma profusum TaxID=2771354 RepID=A0A926XX84_9BACT|nr:gamma-glutamylcyclotransferase family protein [Spirosoma profusum]MBD2702544.1 gamma-glutamylcyclotransferase [Spirosoma profusum]
MMQDADYLFVYGTLRASFQNPFAQYLRQYSRYVGEGIFSGQLFDIGTYPGAIYQPDSSSFVRGDVYDISQHKSELLLRLDEYEGIGATFAQPQEYVREIITADCVGETLRCWIYLYNFPVDGKRLIGSGDYESR